MEPGSQYSGTAKTELDVFEHFEIHKNCHFFHLLLFYVTYLEVDTLLTVKYFQK